MTASLLQFMQSPIMVFIMLYVEFSKWLVSLSNKQTHHGKGSLLATMLLSFEHDILSEACTVYLA